MPLRAKVVLADFVKDHAIPVQNLKRSLVSGVQQLVWQGPEEEEEQEAEKKAADGGDGFFHCHQDISEGEDNTFEGEDGFLASRAR